MSEGRNTAGLILDDREDGIFRVHRSAFVDREIFEQERARIFDRSWLFAGHVSEFPKPGDFVTRSVAGRPVILANGDDGRIRVLMNTCRHRGNLVCREERGTANFSAVSIMDLRTRGELKFGEEASERPSTAMGSALETGAAMLTGHRLGIFSRGW
jgi:hypothetical protein